MNLFLMNFLRPALALTLSLVSLLLAACGASSEEAKLADFSPATVTSVVSPARVVAGQIYTYKADASSGSTITWSWGDGSPSSVGSTVQKVWNLSGTQTVSLSAKAGTSTASVTQSVVVVGDPVAAGGNHTCALQPGGSVLCWGDNSFGQMGNGTSSGNVPQAITVTGLTNAIALSAGANHTCALKAGGRVECWGRNHRGQIGNGTTSTSVVTPTVVTGLTDAVAITAGDASTCAIRANTSVVCWGDNYAGQLGDGTTATRVITTPVTGLAGVVAISAGDVHVCALKANGAVVCWGDNRKGQIGDGTTGNIRTTTVVIAGLTDTVALSGGLLHTCALKANRSVACWGFNGSGELGDGTLTDKFTPTVLDGLTDAVAITLDGNFINTVRGAARSCALKGNGSVACWGDVSYDDGTGQLAAQNKTTPTVITGLTDTAAVSAGGSHVCALKTSGAVACWGNGVKGQLGDGTSGNITTNLVAVTAPGGLLTDTTGVSAGFYHTCALKVGGSVACWGDNQFGQAGNGTTATSVVTATTVVVLTDAVELSVGGYHTCARKADNTVVCWGYNQYGQLGNGTPGASVVTPTLVPGLTNAVELSAGSYHTCARKADNTVVCWGSNGNGQLGNGTLGDSLVTPTLIPGLTNAVELSAGYFHTCARKADNTVFCWGYNGYGQVGNGTTSPSVITPTLVLGLTDTVELSAAGYHTCTRKADNTVFCWGYNQYGQLGNGTTATSVVTPTLVPGLTNTVELSAGAAYHTCVRKADNTVFCWGNNQNGQLGSGATGNNIVTPTLVPSLTDAVELSVGIYHTCARKADSTVVCWGYNGYGQLGGSTSATASVKPQPTPILGGAIFWK